MKGKRLLIAVLVVLGTAGLALGSWVWTGKGDDDRWVTCDNWETVEDVCYPYLPEHDVSIGVKPNGPTIELTTVEIGDLTIWTVYDSAYMGFDSGGGAPETLTVNSVTVDGVFVSISDDARIVKDSTE
ncbi:MAG: hypothetical protein ACYSUI_17270 [Planctomycetota bacterium]